MKIDVWAPNEPLWTTAVPGMERSASATLLTPARARSAPPKTLSETGREARGVARRVAVTTTGFRVAVSGCWAETTAKGVERKNVERRRRVKTYGMVAPFK